MPTITLSSKHQVTLPVDIVRSLGLKAGDKLVAELIDGRVVLLPQPESWTDYFVGSMKGVYGSTKEEIDRYIAEVRYGWDIGALKDALALDPEMRQVYEATSSAEARAVSQIREASGVKYTAQKLDELEELQAINPVERPQVDPQGGSERYYRRTP
jgi:AbrB family looped-hinge helix DNA binding protein